MISVNLYAIPEIEDEDKKRILDAIDVMKEIVNGVSKCYGGYKDRGVLDEAILELRSILYGEMKY